MDETNTLTMFSDALADSVDHVGPSVVRVEGRRRLAASGIAWRQPGIIVTASHVVRRDGTVRVGLSNGDAADAQLIGRDPTTDLAVLQAEADTLPGIEWVQADALRVGQLALALGRPGRTVQATLGIVSALSGEWQAPSGGRFDHYLQTDVVMYPGFSGGPLVDAAGRVVGLNTSAIMRGVSLAVPTRTVERVVTALLTHGHVRRGYLGVNVQTVGLPAATAKSLGRDSGVLVVAVEPGSPAEEAGVLLGDVIVTLGDAPTARADDLFATLGAEGVGQPVMLRVLRAGALTALSVTVGERE